MEQGLKIAKSKTIREKADIIISVSDTFLSFAQSKQG